MIDFLVWYWLFYLLNGLRFQTGPELTICLKLVLTCLSCMRNVVAFVLGSWESLSILEGPGQKILGPQL